MFFPPFALLALLSVESLAYNARMANQFLALSLFVMLLSFFIILNSLSSFEETKAVAVLDSISTTFSSRDAVSENLAPTTVQSPAVSIHEGDMLTRLEEFFDARIIGVDIRKNETGTLMRVRMPLKKFENAIALPEASARRRRPEAGGFFLPTLVSLLQTQNTTPYRMDMVLNLGESMTYLKAADSVPIRKELKKIAKIAEQLEAGGLPQKLLTAGVGAGKAGFVDLYFHRYEPLVFPELSLQGGGEVR